MKYLVAVVALISLVAAVLLALHRLNRCQQIAATSEAAKAFRHRRHLCKRDLDLLKMLSDPPPDEVPWDPSKAKPAGWKEPLANHSRFYKVVMAPLETVCSSKASMGGRWRAVEGYDGGKVVCLDDFSIGRPCLVYSLGLGGDLSFEQAMLDLGCEVFGYDTVVDRGALDGLAANASRLHVTRKLIGTAKDAAGNASMVRFDSELAANGHGRSNLTYLKVDVEGGEEDLLVEWLQQGLLDRVEQIGVELHHVTKHVEKDYDMIRKLYAGGFRIISWQSNLVFPGHLLDLFELVMVKKKSFCE